MRWRDWYGDGSLLVGEIALACCALEVAAALPDPTPPPRPELVEGPPFPEPLSPFPEPVEGQRTAIIVSGTVTDRLAPAVLALIDAGAEAGLRPTVISFGACAASGGPYWDSYAVTKGVDQLVPVDIYVPGCPPTPDALAAVLDNLVGRVVP